MEKEINKMDEESQEKEENEHGDKDDIDLEKNLKLDHLDACHCG
jgi:hypothetical protein